MPGTESTDPKIGPTVHYVVSEVTTEQVEALIRQAYQRGWESARYWPNRSKPGDLDIRWWEHDDHKGVQAQIIESPPS